MSTKDKQPAKVRVTLLRSLEGRTAKQRSTVRGLGLKRINDTSELLATQPVMGMIEKVKFMLKCEEVSH